MNYMELMSQTDGNVFIDGKEETLVVRKEDTMALLSTVLNAIRTEGDAEKVRACLMMCSAMLGSFK